MRMVDGMLTRDSAFGKESCVSFWPEHTRDDICRDRGFWFSNQCRNPDYDDEVEWSIDEWRATYDVPPPRLGQAEKASVQL